MSVFASAPLAEGGVLRNETLKARPCRPHRAGYLFRILVPPAAPARMWWS